MLRQFQWVSQVMSIVTAVVLLAGIGEFRGLFLRHDCVNSSAHFEELCEKELEMLLNHLSNTNPLRTVVFTYSNWCEVLREVSLDMGEHKRENRQTPGQQSLSTTGTACHSLLLQSTFPASPDTPTYLPPEFQTELWICHLQSVLQIRQAY